jgi:Uma2 family endonuclease
MVTQLDLKPDQLITAADLADMGDIGPYELVRGELVPMTPTAGMHGRCETLLTLAIGGFVKEHNLGEVWGGEVGIFTHRNPDTVRGADLLYITRERITPDIGSGFLTIAPDLIVEITSPNDRWLENITKLQEYFSIGVRLVWIVVPETKTVYAYKSVTDVRGFNENDTLTGDDVIPGFSIQVAKIFR